MLTLISLLIGICKCRHSPRYTDTYTYGVDLIPAYTVLSNKNKVPVL